MTTQERDYLLPRTPKKPAGHWDYAGRVARHLRTRRQKWKVLAEIWGTTPGVLYNAAFLYPNGARRGVMNGAT